MKTTALSIALVFAAVMFAGYVHQNKTTKHPVSAAHDTLYTYQKNILPLLQANCNPCHFPGGKVYKKLPFNDYKTVASLGKKLNTRLKQKEQQAIILGWVQSGARESN